MENPKISVESLYVDHHTWLYVWLKNKLRSHHSAEDLVQETFVKVMQARQQLLGIKEPKAYLTSIAKNLLIDQYRRKELERAYLEELIELQITGEDIVSPEAQIVLLDAIDHLCRALSNVSVKAQQAFVLHYIEGNTHKEIATYLGVSTKMIQKYLAKCLVECYAYKQKINDSI